MLLFWYLIFLLLWEVGESSTTGSSTILNQLETGQVDNFPPEVKNECKTSDM